MCYINSYIVEYITWCLLEEISFPFNSIIQMFLSMFGQNSRRTIDRSYRTVPQRKRHFAPFTLVGGIPLEVIGTTSTSAPGPKTVHRAALGVSGKRMKQ